MLPPKLKAHSHIHTCQMLLLACLVWGSALADDDSANSSASNSDPMQAIAAEGREDPELDNKKLLKAAPLLGSDWAFSFGGYAKVDFISDFAGSGDKRQFVLGQIPVDGNPPPGSYSNLQVAETRFHLEARNINSAYANDNFYLELDFYDDTNKLSPRLRHVYFQYGNLLAGRKWTLLTEMAQLPLLLDFAAGDSILGGRTEQIRWTQANAAGDFAWAVALENFDDGEIFNPTDLEGEARSDFPRLAVGMTKIWPRLRLSAGGAVTQIRWDGSDAVADETEAGYTFTTAGRLYLDDSKANWLGFGVGYAAGSITDIITYANARVPNAAIDANGNLEVAKGWNTQIGVHWEWTPVWSSNASVAYSRLTDVPLAFDPDFIRTGGSVHANVIYKFDDRLKAGFEVMQGYRENVSGSDGDAFRMQFGLFYYY